MNPFLTDSIHGLRRLVRSPGFALVTVLSLALGIGSTTAIFSAINALLLRPSVAVDDPDELAAIYVSDDNGGPYGPASFPDYLDIRDHVDALDGVAAFKTGAFNLRTESGQRTIFAEIVTGNYFDVLGVEPVLGRTFTPEETEVGASERVAVISHRLWTEEFARDPGALSRSVRLDGDSYQVIGVAPEGFTARLFALRADVWVPLGSPGGVSDVSPTRLADRDDRAFLLLARRRAGVSLEEARAQLEVETRRLLADHREPWTLADGRPRAATMIDERESRLAPALRNAATLLLNLLLAAMGGVLLLAASNIANLVLAKTAGRRREIALRRALGAGRRRLVAQLLTEILPLALLGGLGGVLLARFALDALGQLPLPFAVPIQFDFSLDLRVLLFALILTLASLALVGWVPAWQASRLDLVPALKDDERAGRLSRSRLRDVLVVVQVAGSLALLSAALLFLRSLHNAGRVEIGFDPRQVAVMSVVLPSELEVPEGLEKCREIMDRLARQPDVEAVAMAAAAPLSLISLSAEARVEGNPQHGMELLYNAVTPGYFEALEVPLVRGRAFTAQDRSDSAPVAVVNETLARRLAQGGPALGRRIAIDDGEMAEVVGVARDGKYRSLGEEPQPFLWVPLSQSYQRRLLLHVRSRTDGRPLLAKLEQENRSDEGEIAIVPPTAMSDLIAFNVFPQRVGSMLLSAASVLALLLAMAGIYGIVSVTVALRAREVGIRIAVGAGTGDVVRLLIRGGLSKVAVGMLAGLALSVLGSRVLGAFLFGVGPLDPAALGGGVALLGLVALAACLVPAWRAAARVSIHYQRLRSE